MKQQQQQQQHAVLLLPPTADIEAPAVDVEEDHDQRDIYLRNYNFPLALSASGSLLASVFMVALTVRMLHGSERLVLTGISIFFGLLFEACIVWHHLYAE